MWWAASRGGRASFVPLAPFWVLLRRWYAASSPAMARLGDSGRILSEALRTGFVRLAAHRGCAAVDCRPLAAVAVNYVNFEVLLRSIYPTDQQSPRIELPAQPLTDLLNSPVAYQFLLMNMDFRANTI